MSELKKLPDLNFIESFIIQYGAGYKANIKLYFKYKYECFKQIKLKFEIITKTPKMDTNDIIRFCDNTNKELLDIYYNLQKRLNRLNIKLNTADDNFDSLTPDDFYSSCNDTKTFINELTKKTDNMEKLLLIKYIKDIKYNFYFKSSINYKIEQLNIIFMKFNNIYHNLNIS